MPRGGSISFNAPLVKVKVHHKDDIFVIQVERTVDYLDLMDKVAKKIRLCGSKLEGQGFKVRYRDEDGDMITLASNDDLQIALDFRSVTLFVV